MRYPHRCMNCWGRCVLKRKITDYTLRRRCPHCHAFRLWFDKAHYNYRRNRKLCFCDGLPWGDAGHRPGSSVWCIKHKTGPTQADYELRYGVTPDAELS